MWPDRLDDLPRGVVLGRDVPVAAGCAARLLGLSWLGRADAGDGLLIPHCASVHTFGMRFDLDLFFLDARGEVLTARLAVPPRRFVRQRRAAAVLEIPSPLGGELSARVP